MSLEACVNMRGVALLGLLLALVGRAGAGQCLVENIDLGCRLSTASCPSGYSRRTSNCVLGTRTNCLLYTCCAGYTGSGCTTPICPGCQRGTCSAPGSCTPCESGWSGTNCDTCALKIGCSQGTCTSPGECNCKPGWSGTLCNTCIPKTGCKQGTCVNPGECNCNSGWSGTFCETPVCNQNCQQGTCTAPNVCTCSPGWTSNTAGGPCTVPVKSATCVNGNAGGVAFGCSCDSGWSGTNCNVAICLSGCSSQYGSCTTPGTCTCAAGWGGALCNTCVVAPGCQQGSCTKAFECICRSGWSGALCDAAICRTGCQYGTCGVPGTCVCQSGWSGTLCDKPICAQGCDPTFGSCVTPGTCICQTGYTSSGSGLCSAPICRAGCKQGTCTSPGGCDCSPGWTGNLCDTPICSNCVNGICTQPNVCTCTNSSRWTGPACDVPVCAAGCRSGICTVPGTCICAGGQYFGPLCDQPVCSSGCAITRGGYCNVPNECRCSPGWNGTSCDNPICATGCLPPKGTCTKPGTCECSTGWQGSLCTEPVCATGCSSANGFCTAPNSCTCRDTTKWTGAFCTTPVCATGCQYGTCTVPGTCLCSTGYTGALCDRPICAQGCVNGNCISPGVCQCLSGWSGPSCSVAVCSAGCVNGACPNAPNTCNCTSSVSGPLWSGPLCDVAVCSPKCFRGTCFGKPGTCTCNNGWLGEDCDVAQCLAGCSPDHGSCPGMPNTCTCASGWTGALCTTDINECTTNFGGCSPFANCINNDGGYSCSCLPGFSQPGNGMGAQGCIDINECSNANGNCSQVCTNTAGSYFCSCFAGYQPFGSAIGPNGCVDIDECTTTNPAYTAQCSPSATCSNTIGAYSCTCNAGYVGDGFNCTNINECNMGMSNCSPQSLGCVDTVGSFTCLPCGPGYQGDGFSCMPTGVIAVASDSIQQTASAGYYISLTILSSCDAESSVQIVAAGISASRYTLMTFSQDPLTNTTISLAANGNFTFLVYFNISSAYQPQGLLNISLVNPRGAAKNVTSPAYMLITLEASGSVNGIVNMQYQSAIPIALGVPTSIPVYRTPPPSGASMPALTVSWSSTTFPPQNGTVTFAANAQFASFNLLVPNDGTPRLPYTALLSLLPGSDVILGLTTSLQLQVPPANFPNGLVEFARLSASTTQGSTVVMYANRLQGAFGAISVLASCRPGTAGPIQYYCPPTLLSWPDGGKRQQSFTVSINVDDVPRLPTWLLVALDFPTGEASVSVNRSLFNITIGEGNSPRGLLGFPSLDAGTVEQGSTLMLTAVRSAGTFGAVSVGYKVQCDSDIANSLVSYSSSGTFQFPTGVNTATSDFVITSTTTPFLTASCQVSLNPVSLRGGATIDSTANAMTFTLTDYDNNPFGVFGFSAASMASAPTLLTPYMSTFNLVVTRTTAAFLAVVVNVQVLGDNGQQIALTPANGVLRFVANELSKTITVQVVAPTSPQPVGTISLQLSIGSTVDGTLGASIANGTWSATRDAAGAPSGVMSMAATSLSSTIGSLISIPVARAGGTAGSVNVSYNIAPGALGLQAAYVDVLGGVLTFGPGQQTGNILIQLNASTVPALAQSMVVTLTSATSFNVSSPSFLTVARTTALAIAPNNNPYGLFSFGSPASLVTTKGSGLVPITIIRGAGSFGTVTLTFDAGGNATKGVDFSIPQPVVTFLPSQQSATLFVNITPNAAPALLLTLNVVCTSVSPAVVPLGGSTILFGTPNTFVISILPANNIYGFFEIAPLANATVAPGLNSILSINVTRTIGTVGPMRVYYGTSNSIAQPGVDFAFLRGNVSLTTTSSYVDFRDGQTIAFISIALLYGLTNLQLSSARRRSLPAETPNTLGLQLFSCQTLNPYSNTWVATTGCSVNMEPLSPPLTIVSNCMMYGCRPGVSCSRTWPPTCYCPDGYTGPRCETLASSAAVSDNSSGSSSSIFIIIAVVAGGIVLVLVIAFLIRRRRSRYQSRRKVAQSTSGIMSAFHVDANGMPNAYGHTGVFVNPVFSEERGIPMGSGASMSYSEVTPYAVSAAQGRSYNHLTLHRDMDIGAQGVYSEAVDSNTDFFPPAESYLDVQATRSYSISRPRNPNSGEYTDNIQFVVPAAGDNAAAASGAGVSQLYSMPNSGHASTKAAAGGLSEGYLAVGPDAGAPASSGSVPAEGFYALGSSDSVTYAPVGTSYAELPGGYQGRDGGYAMVTGSALANDGGYTMVQGAKGSALYALGSAGSRDGGYAQVVGAPPLADSGYAAVQGVGPTYAVPMAEGGEASTDGATAESTYGVSSDGPKRLWNIQWLYPQLDRVAVETALTKGGSDDGKFLVRRKESKDVYALSTIHKGSVCHHLLVQDKDGWHINGFQVAHCRTLEDVVEYVRLPRPNVNQPQALSTPVHD